MPNKTKKYSIVLLFLFFVYTSIPKASHKNSIFLEIPDMKGKGAENTENLSSKLTLLNNFAVVKYENGMSFHTLLKIFGISESKTDLVRALLGGNGLIYNNGVLLLSNGSTIPSGKVIQMQKKLISSDILKGANTKTKEPLLTSFEKSPASEKPIYPLAPASESKQTALSVRESFSLLMNDPMARYISYGGCAALVIMISTGVYIALTDDDTPKGSQATDTEEIIVREEKFPKKSSRISEKEEKKETKFPRTTPTPLSPKTITAREKSPPSSEPLIATLDPDKPVRDMSNVGTIAISEKSSREEIARAIRAFNDVYSPPSNTKHKP